MSAKKEEKNAIQEWRGIYRRRGRTGDQKCRSATRKCTKLSEGHETDVHDLSCQGIGENNSC